MSSARLRLWCRGVVQGVGFRPLVHRLAAELQLVGEVENVAGAVRLELQGERRSLELLVRRLPEALQPPGALEPLAPEWLPPLVPAPPGLRIAAATAQPLGAGLIASALAADLAPCPTCLAELADPGNRRYRYPFISCSQCGPRYSIATAEPYARAHTSLAAFPLCALCQKEFDDPGDRRFHAETIACPACGPQLQLQWQGGGAGSVDPLAAALTLLAAGDPAAVARACELTIVTGDTKVVERGKADGIFLTTSGIGVVEAPAPIHPTAIRPGDQLLLSGDLGRHGVAILAARHGLALVPPVLSDCAPLWPQVRALLEAGVRIHCLRDLTRGGLASALQELAEAAAVELAIEEARLPVLEPVARTCELLGFEPLHLANEGRFVVVVPPSARDQAQALLAASGGAWIGSVRPASKGSRVLLTTAFGTERLLLPLSGELLPRIC